MSTLTICKASAGSGKTHKLTGEYLKLIFNPEIRFRNILAVTFTNKATAEMRERILEALSTIANGRESDYAADLCKIGYTPESLKEKAQTLLKQMLNQYSYFKVSTIDSFFQQVIKSITYELGLDTGFSLELDSKSVIDNAVSRIIDNFGGNDDECQMILDIINDKMSSGKRWEIQSEVSGLASDAFNKVPLMDPPSNEKIKEFKKELKKITDNYTKKVSELGNKSVELIKQNGLTADNFYYGSNGVFSFFGKCAQYAKTKKIECGDRTVNAFDDINKMSKDKNTQSVLIQSGLYDIFKQLFTLINSQEARLAATAEVVLANLGSFALVSSVTGQRRQICEEQNLFLLSSSMPFLKKMIGDNDAPFIYERFGYVLDHFMIDEFQDTSTLNWGNFMPLIWNKVAEDCPSLIVGDVKQAIYRWRGGDWNLLDNVVQNDFHIDQKEIENLEYNWRSCENIVKFNNWCFKTISDTMSRKIGERIANGTYKSDYGEMFERTYSDAVQKIPEQNATGGGFVSVDYVGKDDDYDAVAAEWIIGQIDSLAELGYQPGDIAILVRWRKDGTKIANCLAQAQAANPENAGRYRFVSSEAVLLGNNQAIRLLVSAMQFLTNPAVPHIQAQLIWLYYAVTDSLETAAKMIQQTTFGADAASVWEQLPEEFAALKDTFRQLDLIQLSSRLTKAFFGLPHEISTANQPFINEFEDRVQTFNERYGSNLQLFVEWWDEIGYKQPVAMNSKQNAIQIMTIHASKGLEFKAVLLPYIDPTERGNKKNTLWCSTTQAPFNQFEQLPIDYNEAMAATFFSDSYYQEQFMRHVDNLNTIYVAFTRASRDMRILIPESNAKEKKDFSDLKTLGTLLESAVNNPDAAFSCDENRITVGTEQPYKSAADTDITDDEVQYNSCANPAKINIKHNSRDFFEGVDFDRIQRINVGKLYHQIFEHIKYAGDVHEAVAAVADEGLIAADKKADYERAVSRFIAKQPDWFSQRWTVLTEQQIMLADGENRIRRPDRILESDTEVVVIDYKFTSHHNPDYNQQVSVYIDALRKLTGKKVSGYLWYVWPNEKIEVVG
ncbi:MAG: UvrD-helicase domain-containing protein [Salinivirgaceae bacterium]|nr:UvrD-helicase domain-containing protein [Salinivirgaceae bacterium]